MQDNRLICQKSGVNPALPKAIFIAGTDTGVGKTVVVGLLGRYFLGKGYRAITQKWVQTGYNGFSCDIDIHLDFMDKRREDFKSFYPYMMPYAFRLASSPHLAARLEGKRISIKKIESSFEMLRENFDFTIVEGVGGLMVPLDKRNLLIDLVERISLPVLLVAANRLGAINHTLLAIEGLRARKIDIVGVIFNNISKNEKGIVLKDNPRIVEEMSKQRVFGVLPWAEDPYKLYNKFILLGDKILAQL